MDENVDQTKGDDKLIDIKRDALNWEQFSDKYSRNPSKDEPLYRQIAFLAEKRWNRFSVISLITSLFPIIEWLPKYPIKDNLLADIMAGVTISVLHVPQGIGNAFIMGLKPTNGLYVSFFPVLIYTLMGTSRHISIGTFAVASLMVNNVAVKLGAVSERPLNSTTNDWPPTNVEVITAVCMTTGLIQLLMGCLSLGSLSLILSDDMISSLTTGVAFHVIISQLATILGLKTSNRDSGPKVIIVSLQLVIH